jgi:tight adherence protein C
VKRTRALARSGTFRLTEPTIRYLAARLPRSYPHAVRSRTRATLSQSGDYLGLSEDELLAMCALSAAVFGGLVCLLRAWLDLSWLWCALAFLLGALTPWLRVQSVAFDRAQRVTRSLPRVIDLAAMCMGAGLDFPTALRRIVESATDAQEPTTEELQRVLQELDLGRTRKSALRGLATRVPSPEIRELVNSVLQAENKGSPLARVLTIQAQTLRLRRSAAAEEAASEAALMLVGPMSLIFLCVIVLLLGPVAVRVMTGGFAHP